MRGVVLVAWFFLAVLQGGPVVVGPFDSKSDCNEIRAWTATQGATVSPKCWDD